MKSFFKRLALLGWLGAGVLPGLAYMELSDQELEDWKQGNGITRIEDGVVERHHLKPDTVLFVSGFSTNGAAYYVYLPPDYTPENPMPLLLGFAPSANGLTPIIKVAPSAREKGWLVVGVDQVGNNTYTISVIRTYEVIRHVRKSIPHNRTREYTFGSSGGACRAFRASREYWGEFAGVVNNVGWMCNYDRFTFYPERIAVAHLSGEKDYSHLFYQKSDHEIIERYDAASRQFMFPGGHQWAPPQIWDNALDWLEEDFVNRGTQLLTADAENRAGQWLAEMDEKLASTNYGDMALAGAEILKTYPYTTAIDPAISNLVTVFSQDDLRKQVVLPSGFEEPNVVSDILWQRGRLTDSAFPLSHPRAFYEFSVLCNPSNSWPLAALGYELIRPMPRTKPDFKRAEALAKKSSELDPELWYAWHIRSLLANKKADFVMARDSEVKSRALAPRRYKPYTTRHKEHDTQKSLYETGFETRLYAPHVEHFDGFEEETWLSWIPGWYGPTGQAYTENAAYLTGGWAVILEGSNTVVRCNLLPTQDKIWADVYTLPDFTDQPGEPCIYSNSLNTFYFDTAGGLSVWDGVMWHRAAGSGVETGQWHRVTMGFDFVQSTYEVYWNDVRVFEDLPVSAAAAEARFLTFTGHGTNNTYIDAFGLYETRPPLDGDLDTLPDRWEIKNGLDPRESGLYHGANADPDEDGLMNYREYLVGTHPLINDTDGDGMSDGAEVTHGFDPLAGDEFESLDLPSAQHVSEGLESRWVQLPGTRANIYETPDREEPVVHMAPSAGSSGLTQYFSAGPKSVIWIELSLKPQAGEPPRLDEAIQNGSAVLYINARGRLVVFDGRADARKWVELNNPPVPEGEWIRLMVRLDYRLKTWSLWYKGDPLMFDLGFANPDKAEFSSIAFQGTGWFESYSADWHGPDRDNDSIPDDWETVFFGDTTVVDGSSDQDGDGFTDRSEYLAGTDPRDPESLLRIDNVEMRGKNLVISWESKARNYEGNPISYRLLRTKNLVDSVAPPIACEVTPGDVHCEYVITNITESLREYIYLEVKE